MSIYELCEILGLKLLPSRSSNTVTLTFDFACCSSTFNFCALNYAVSLSSRNRTSASSSAMLTFFFNALSLFDDLELDDDVLECLLDLFDDTLPDTLVLFDLASMAASLSHSISLIQPWIFCLNCSMLASISSNQSSSLACCSTGNKTLYSLCTSVTILNRSSTGSKHSSPPQHS